MTIFSKTVYNHPSLRILGLSLFILLTVLVAGGCGVFDDDDDSSDSYVTHSVSGTLSIANAQSGSAGIGSFSNDPSNYYIFAQNQRTKEIFLHEVADNSGDFSIDIDELESSSMGGTFFFGILKKDPLSFVGPLIRPSGDVKSTGFEIDGDVSNFDITFDASKLKAEIDDVDLENLEVETEIRVRLDDDGEPVGLDNSGKASKADVANDDALNDDNLIDGDEDGVPDILDAKNDGQNLDNAVSDGGPKRDGIFRRSNFDHAIMFMNLKVDYEHRNDADMVTDNATVVVELATDHPSRISSVRAAAVHSNYDDATMDQAPGGFTAVDTWPAEHSQWDASSPARKLYHMINPEGQHVWTAIFRPNNNDFEPGNLVLLEVSLTSGATKYYLLTINFKFTTLPTMTNSWTAPSSGSGTSSDPFVINATGGYTFDWNNPDDESGSELTGLDYQFELFYYDGDTGPANQVGDRFVIEDREAGVTDKYDVSQAEFDQNRPTADLVQLDITGRYPYGDNTALKMYIKRSGW